MLAGNVDVRLASDRNVTIATVDHVVPQPSPKNDPGAKPLWPMIIAEIERRIDEKYCADSGMNRDAEVLRLVVSDMKKRHEFGVSKYGVPLVAKNDRDHLSDAYQEILDGIVYFRAEIERCGGFDRKITALQLNAVECMYSTLVEMAVDLRGYVSERDGR